MKFIIIFLGLYLSLIQFIVANQIDVKLSNKINTLNGESENELAEESIEDRHPYQIPPQVYDVENQARVRRHWRVDDPSSESNSGSSESDETTSDSKSIKRKHPNPIPYPYPMRLKRLGIWKRRPETRSATTTSFNTDYGLAGTIRDHYVPSAAQLNYQDENNLFETPNEEEEMQSDSAMFYRGTQTRLPVAWSRGTLRWKPKTKSLYGSGDYGNRIRRGDAKVPRRGVGQSSTRDALYQQVVDDYDYGIDNLDFYQKWLVHNFESQREAHEAFRQPIVPKQPELRSGYGTDRTDDHWTRMPYYHVRYGNYYDQGKTATTEIPIQAHPTKYPPDAVELPPKLELKTNDQVYFDEGIDWRIYKTVNGLTRLGTKNGEVIVRIVRPLPRTRFNRDVQEDDTNSSEESQELPNFNIGYNNGQSLPQRP